MVETKPRVRASTGCTELGRLRGLWSAAESTAQRDGRTVATDVSRVQRHKTYFLERTERRRRTAHRGHADGRQAHQTSGK